MRNVYVLGVGMIKFGRYPDKDVHELAAEAALLALKDAGMTIKDIELLASRQPAAGQQHDRRSASCSRSARPASR